MSLMSVAADAPWLCGGVGVRGREGEAARYHRCRMEAFLEKPAALIKSSYQSAGGVQAWRGLVRGSGRGSGSGNKTAQPHHAAAGPGPPQDLPTTTAQLAALACYGHFQRSGRQKKDRRQRKNERRIGNTIFFDGIDS